VTHSFVADERAIGSRFAKANISLFIVASLGWGAALGQAEQVLGQLGLELSEVSQVDSGAF
jgi:hypothetical protein